jgi:hypothetical protein
MLSNLIRRSYISRWRRVGAARAGLWALGDPTGHACAVLGPKLAGDYMLVSGPGSPANSRTTQLSSKEDATSIALRSGACRALIQRPLV